MKECHDLIKDFMQKKSGQAAQGQTPQGPGSSSVGVGPVSSTSSSIDGGERLAIAGDTGLDMNVDAEDPVVAQAREWAARELDRVHVCRTEGEFRQEVKGKLYCSHRLAVVIDAQTSRQKVSNDYLEVAKNIITDTGIQKFAIVLVAGPRLDLLHSMQVRANKLFRGDDHRVSIIQMVSGEMQSRKSQPGWLLLIKKSAENERIPFSLELLGSRVGNLLTFWASEKPTILENVI